MASLLFLTTADLSAAAAVPAQGAVLAWQDAGAAVLQAGFVPLHRLQTGTIGLLPGDVISANLATGTRILGPAGDGSLLLVTPSTAAMVARGELPPAWSTALASSGDAGSSLPLPTASELRAIPALASDDAVVLLRLPAWLSVIADAPGCRAQKIDPAAAPAAAKLESGTPGAAESSARGSAPVTLLPTADPALLTALVRAVNSDRMMADLDTLSSGLRTRSTTTPQFGTACQYALAAFQSLGLPTSLDPFTVSGHLVNNVVAVKTGTTYPTRIIIISGHLDSTSPSPTSLAPGAEDNGSGSAAVIEAARLLVNIPCEYTIQFILFAGEEQGLLGSAHYATEADAQNLDIRAMLTMDMIAYNDPAGAQLWIEGFHQGTSSVWLMNLLDTYARTYCGLTTYLYPGEGWGSDHESFHDHGFSAVLAIENEYDSYPCYHQTCDTVDRLDPAFWRMLAASVIVTTADQAGATAQLGWIDGYVTVAGGASPAGAVISLTGTSWPPVTVDGTGHFSFAGVLQGAYNLTATKAGCTPTTVPVNVPAGGGANPAPELQPLEPGSITGVVHDALGATISGARIEVEGMSEIISSANDGTFSVTGVLPGTVAVCATYPGLTMRGKSVNVSPGHTTGPIDFVLKDSWDFEAAPEGLIPTTGWSWGTDTMAGAHSGSKVWGTVLGGNYANCANYQLDMPALSLTYMSHASLRCWIWYRTQAAYDGGNVQISTDGGATWAVVAPTGGYGGALSGSCNPLTGQQGFQGIAATWAEKVFPLDAYVGHWIRLRFAFGSSSSTTERGWYIDDLSLVGQPSLNGVPGDGPVATGIDGTRATLRVVPNPASGNAGIVLRLPAETTGRCEVFAASGRRVAVLAAGLLPAGERTLHWDGRDNAGRPAAAGIYWAAWHSAGDAVRVPIVLLK